MPIVRHGCVRRGSSAEDLQGADQDAGIVPRSIQTGISEQTRGLCSGETIIKSIFGIFMLLVLPVRSLLRLGLFFSTFVFLDQDWT
jgi:hypothetical protein